MWRHMALGIARRATLPVCGAVGCMNGPIRLGHVRYKLGTTNSEGVSDRG